MSPIEVFFHAARSCETNYGDSRIFSRFFLVLAFLPFICWAESNVDPRTENIVIDVDTISITSTDNAFEQGITLPSIMKMANDLRGNYPRSMRFDQIQAISDAITLYLREQGYKFHYAFIPPQKPKSGIVTISIIDISLSDVRVMNRSYFSSKRITDLFQNILHKPLYQPDVDRVLRALQRNRSINVFAYYSRGSKPKSVRLNINVSAKERWDLGLSVDNYGASASGKNRAMMQLALHNPINRFDQLSLGLLQSYGEAENNYGYLFYQTALMNIHHAFSIYASNSVFEVGGDFSNIGLEGDASLGEVSYTNHFFYGEKMHQSLSVSYAEKANDFTSVFNDDAVEPDEDSSSASVTWRVDHTNKFSSKQLQARWYSGEFTLNGQMTNKRDFERFTLDYQYYRRFTPEKSAFALEAHLRYQHSDQRLPSFERMSLTGATGVRGFESGQYSVDKSKIASLALHLPAYHFGRVEKGSLSLRSNIFTEWASGYQYDLNGDEVNNLSFSSVGLALKLNLGSHLYTSMTLAAPVGARSGALDGFRRQPFSFSLTVKR